MTVYIIRRLSPKARELLRSRFVEVTMDGLSLVERWFHAPRIAPELTKTYQMLLQLVWAGGRLRADLASKLWHRDVLITGIRNKYIRLVQKTDRFPVEVQKKISEIVNRSSGEYYV